MRKSVSIFLLIMLPLISAGQPAQWNPIYQPGEMLRYQMYYGLINAGEAILEIDSVTVDGKELWHLSATGYTTGLANRLFNVYDVYESFTDPHTGLPVKAIRNISEGRYKYYNEVTYNRDSNTVYSQRSGSHEVPEGILDIVSSIYHLRDRIDNTTLLPGQIIELQAYFGDEIYPVIVRYRGPETINTRMGRFSALKFSPVSEPGRLFKTEDDITVWFSNDKNLVPLRVSLNMMVGAVRMDLIQYEGIPDHLIHLK